MLFDTYHRQIKNSFSISKISLYVVNVFSASFGFLFLKYSLYLYVFRNDFKPMQCWKMWWRSKESQRTFFIKATRRLFRYEVNACLLKVFATFSARHCVLFWRENMLVSKKSPAFCINSHHFKTGILRKDKMRKRVKFMFAKKVTKIAKSSPSFWLST